MNVIVGNKNLLDATKGVNAYISPRGELINDSSKSNFLTDYIKIDNNIDYILSIDLNVSQFALCYFDSNKNFIERYTSSSLLKQIIFSHTTAKYVRCVAYQSSIQFTPENMINTYKFQLEKGSTATDYTPHKSQTYTFPLAQGQKLMLGDYIASDGIHHVRKQIVINGTESIELKGVGTDNRPNRFYFTNIKVKRTGRGLSNLFPNWYTIGRTNYYTNEGLGSNDTSDSLELYLKETTIGASTENAAKAWLAEKYNAGTPLIVEYELQNEIIDPFTPTQQAVYDEIRKKAKSYKGGTYIYSTDEISPVFEVEYHKDLQAENENLQSQIDNVKQAIASLGGVIDE